MSELLQVGIALAVIIVVVGIVLHSKLSAVHAAALAPVSVALVPISTPDVAVAPAAPAAVASAPSAPASDPANPFVAYKAQGVSLYDLMAPGKLGRYLTAAELAQAKAAGYDTSTLEPAPVAADDPSFDPSKTNLDPADFGKVFKANPPGTTYTLNVPNGARVFMLRDGEFFADQWATYSVDGAAPEKCIFTGPIAQLSVGTHTVTVACNYEMSFQIQP